tara:strand:+ start:387 stop:605 length:219 start_codon:yes stop_codon:yes gene_type:complete
MFIDNYKIDVKEKVWDEKKQSYKKNKEVVASIQDSSGISSKNFGRFLDDLSDNNITFRGTISVHVIIDRGEY